MEAKRFHRLLGCASALYFIGSAAVAQAQDAELPFVPVLTIGSTALVNDDVFANADGSFTLLGNQQGGSINGQPVWDLAWDLTMNQDPSIAGSVVLSNLSTTTRNFTVSFALPITPAFSPALFGGSISARLEDANGDLSASLAPQGGGAIYRGLIDGSTVLSLFAANLSCVASTPGCVAGGAEFDGLPGPSLPFPGASDRIGILLTFSLSAGDRVSFDTNFVVEPPSPVPVPAALPLMILGLTTLALKRRVNLTGR